MSGRLRFPTRRTWRVLAMAAAGAVVAVMLAARTSAVIGPFLTTVSARPSLDAHTVVHLPPLGTITLESHTAPIALEVRVDELRVGAAERIVHDPMLLAGLEDRLAADARAALDTVARRLVLAAVVGGAVGGLVAAVRLRTLLGGGLVGAVLAATVGGATVATYDPSSLAEPRYSGLLTVAPRALGDVQSIISRFGEYRAQLTDLVTNAVVLYRAGSSLPDLRVGDGSIRVLHVSDIHLNPQAFDLMEGLIEQFDVDVVVDTGDITDFGSDIEEAVLDGVADLPVPYLWVRGNHDSRRTQAAMAAIPNVRVLDGGGAFVAGLRFWGVGDPRFTPAEASDVEAERRVAREFGEELADMFVDAQPPAIDVALVHDPRAAQAAVEALEDRADGDDEDDHRRPALPLVLAGHLHRPIDATVGDTRILVQGSTGGAGLRGLQGEEPEPLVASVLYFDASNSKLRAYDQVTVEGIGEAGVTIDRHIVDDVG